MTPDQIRLELRKIAASINVEVDTAGWYLFGSAYSDPLAAADIDVLVICKSDSAADIIRRIVNESGLYRPLHLSILTEAEAAEIGFAGRSGYTRVF